MLHKILEPQICIWRIIKSPSWILRCARQMDEMYVTGDKIWMRFTDLAPNRVPAMHLVIEVSPAISLNSTSPIHGPNPKRGPAL